MKKTTKMEEVKRVLKNFLYLELELDKEFPFIVHHPFFSSSVIATEDGIVDLATEADEAKKTEALSNARKQLEASFDRASDIFSAVTYLHAAYYLVFVKFTKNFLSETDFAKLLAYSWVMEENPNQDPNVSVPVLIRWFRNATKDSLMSPEDYAVYVALPETFEIYRGVAVSRNPKGISWTRNKKTAEWFAHRFDRGSKTGYIQKAVIKKKDALAYFNTRGEDEIVADTRKYAIEKL